ncbi:MAG: hypothetical protein WC479_12025 [Candidatus Izemoplasmatales bacterium]
MPSGDFLDVRVTGIDTIRRRLDFFVTRFPNEVAAALKQEAELTMTESKREVPVDTGSLRNSGFVEEPRINGKNISIKLGYGGVATKVNPTSGEVTTTYAVIVHEDMTANHTVGNAKFLENPIKRRREKLMQNINLRVKRMLEGSGQI